MSDHFSWIMLDEAVREIAQRCGIPGHQAWDLLSRNIETQEINARCCCKRDHQPKPGWEALDHKWLPFVAGGYQEKNSLQFDLAKAIRLRRGGFSLHLPPSRAWNVSLEAVRFDELYPKPPPEDPAIVSIPGSPGTPAAADTAGYLLDGQEGQPAAASQQDTSHETPTGSGVRTNRQAQAQQKATDWFLTQIDAWKKAGRNPTLRLHKQAALDTAQQLFGKDLSGKAFNDRIWPSHAPTEWKIGGKPKSKPLHDIE
jgi:hypothetical protein